MTGSKTGSHRPCGGMPRVAGVALGLLGRWGVSHEGLIGVREVRSGDRSVVVELFRNAGGSVAARCLLADGDQPIIDARSAEEALALVEDALEGLLLARAAGGR